MLSPGAWRDRDNTIMSNPVTVSKYGRTNCRRRLYGDGMVPAMGTEESAAIHCQQSEHQR